MDYKTIRLGSNVKFDSNCKYIENGSEYYKLQRPIIYALNEGQLLRCYSNAGGLLYIFDLPKDDTVHLNSLLYQLVRMKDIRNGFIQYLKHPTAETCECLCYDSETRVFNQLGKCIPRSSFLTHFTGRIALAIYGLQVIGGYHIYLENTVYQVKIEEEEDSDTTPDSRCMF